MFGIAKFHHAFDAVVSGLALMLNFGLLYLVLKHGSAYLKEYKRVLFAMCVSDISLSAIVFLTHPAILPKDGYILMLSNGWFANSYAFLDHILLALYCAMLHANIICIVVQFVYRYMVICGPKSLKHGGYKIFIWPTLWCVLQAANAIWTFGIGEDEAYRQVGLGILRDIDWQYAEEHAPFPSVAHWSELRTKLHHVVYLISTIGGYSAILWCQYQIMSYMKKNGSHMRESTRRMHAEVNRALIALAIAPLLTSSGPTATIVSLMVFHQSPGAIAALITLGTSLITVINPITTIYFVRPFRKAVLHQIGLKRVIQVSACSEKQARQVAALKREGKDRF